MRVTKTLRLRLLSLIRRTRVEEELDAEIRDHLARQVEMHVAAGMPPPAARAAALRDFGNVALIQEQVRDTRGVRWVEDLGRDLVYALRSMRRAPGHTAVMVLSLAVAIGANSATFALLNTLLLRPLPVEAPRQLVELGLQRPGGQGNFSYQLYQRVRDQSSTFSQVLAVSSPVIRAADESATPPLGRYVSGNFFRALGLRPIIGRLLTPDDDRLGEQGALVTVIGYGLWQRQFGGDESVLGKPLTVGAGPFAASTHRYTIVGVLPRTFQGLTVGRSDDFYLPLTTNARGGQGSLIGSASAGWLKVVGRLRPGVSRDAARAELDVIYARYVDDMTPLSGESVTRQRRSQQPSVESARAGLAGPPREFGRPLMLLMGAVGLVLLIACTNVVNLLLARGVARRGEIAMRLAFGAPRGRLVRQLLTESAVMGLVGGGVGLAFAMWGTPTIAELMANEDPSVAYEVAPDGRVLLFTAVAALGAALAAGLLPALRISRATAPSLRHDAFAGHLGSVTNWTRALIAAQVALSVLLLSGALSLIATLRNFTTGDFGFDREGVAAMRLDPASAELNGERRLAYYQEALERARSLPGVRNAALSSGMPVISSGVDTSLAIEGQPRDPEALVFVNDVTDGYFATTGTRLLSGRDFGPGDTAGSPAVAVINEALAKRYFGHLNPAGRRLDAGIRGVVEVIGVAATTKADSLRENDSPILYVHALQRATNRVGLNLVIKTEGDPVLVGRSVRQAILELGPLRVGPVSSLAAAIDRTLVRERLIARVLGVFALLATLLAGAGLYGVLAFSISRRTPEIGVRLALGATRRTVLWPVLAESTKLVAVGAAIGLPATLALTRLLASVLFGVSPSDVQILTGVVLSLFGIALAAGAIPAWRASRVNPLVALRYE